MKSDRRSQKYVSVSEKDGKDDIVLMTAFLSRSIDLRQFLSWSTGPRTESRFTHARCFPEKHASLNHSHKLTAVCHSQAIFPQLCNL